MTMTVKEVRSAPLHDVSDDPLVALRFTIPSPPKLHVERPRLFSCLDRCADQPLTLVSAPAGTGKTTLVAAWAAQRRPLGVVAWITFEAGDDLPGSFWPVVIDCLRRHGVTVPDCSASSPPTHRRMLVDLSTALANLAHPLTLVLDGYELVDLDVSKDIEFVLGHCGRRLRLVILTRVDPMLPLHRFRLADTIAEVRMADLAFSRQETERLVEQCGVVLRDPSVAALVGRTRGWAAGLRFALMALSGSEDPDAAVGRLAGDTGDIAEYLTTEILQTQAPEVRDLLLRTCVVDVLRPGLIEVLGGCSAGPGLAALAGRNILVEEVAGQPGCYRYHPFLRDLLRAELAYASPSQVNSLRRRAATWFAQRGNVEEAVALSVASAAWADAAGYVVDGLAVARLIAGDDASGLVSALRKAPRGSGGPSAAVVRAALLLADNNPELCAQELSHLRESIDGSPTHADPGVELAVGVIDSVRACQVDDPRALGLVEEMSKRLAKHPLRGSPAHQELTTLIQTSKGVAHLRRGELGEAARTLTAAAHAAEASACRPLPIIALAHLALCACVEGRLQRAHDWASRAVALAEDTGLAPENRPPAAEIALGWVSAERSDLPAAAEHIDASLRFTNIDPIARGLAAVVGARLLRAGGDAAGAVALIAEVGEQVPDSAAWLTDLLHIEAALSQIAQGEPDLALHRIRGLARPDQPAATVVLGRAHLALDDWAGVREVVTALAAIDIRIPRPAALDGRVLEAALELHRAQHARALAALDRALHGAATQGLRRPFREAPPSVRHLLDGTPELLARNPWLDLPSALPPANAARVMERTGIGPGSLTHGEIIEPLTAKEHEVLGHLSELLTTEEIAITMFISVNTVRTHVRSILRKLAVSRRNEAVRRARALSLIGA